MPEGLLQLPPYQDPAEIERQRQEAARRQAMLQILSPPPAAGFPQAPAQGMAAPAPIPMPEPPPPPFPRRPFVGPTGVRPGVTIDTSVPQPSAQVRPETARAIAALTEPPIMQPQVPWYKKLGAAGLATAGSMMPRFSSLANMGANSLLINDKSTREAAMQQERQKNAVQAAQLEQGGARIDSSITAAPYRNPFGAAGQIDADVLEGRTDAYGEPIVAGSGLAYVRLFERGVEKLYPVTPGTRAGPWAVSDTSPTGMEQTSLSRLTGRVANRTPGFQVSAFPRVTQDMGQTTDASGRIMLFPRTSTSTPQIPGLSTPPLRGAQAPPTAPPTPSIVPPAVSTPPEPPGASLPPAQAGAGAATELAGAHVTVTDATRNNWEALGRAVGAYNAFNAMAKDFVKGSGIKARATGVGQWAQSKLGMNDEVTVFNNMREGLRSLFSKFAIGNDVGNLSVQEQQWILETLPKLGMTEGELELTNSFVMDMLLKPRLTILDAVMKGKLDPDKARQETLVQQAQFLEKRAQLAAKKRGQPSASPSTAVSSAATSLPKPQRPNAIIGVADAQKYLDAAGGDPNKARTMAQQNGWKTQ